MARTPTRAELASMHLMGPTQREMIEGEIHNNQGALQGRTMFTVDGDHEIGQQDMRSWGGGFQSPDPAILREAIKRDEETLVKGTPPAYNGYQKNTIYKMVKEAEERILGGMPTHEQMQNGSIYGHVEHFIGHQDYTMDDQQVYLNGMRILYPALEGLSVEALRPYQGGVKSLKPWQQGYDKITWTEEEELQEHLASLDDSVYLQFMELHLQGVTMPRLIQRALGISLGVYEACQARLKLSQEQRADTLKALTPLPSPPEESAPPGAAAEAPGSPDAETLPQRVRRRLLQQPRATASDLRRALNCRRSEIDQALTTLREADDPIVKRWDERQRQNEPQQAAS